MDMRSNKEKVIKLTQHGERHKILYEALRELVDDYFDHTGRQPHETNVCELIAWANMQQVDPTERKEVADES